MTHFAVTINVYIDICYKVMEKTHSGKVLKNTTGLKLDCVGLLVFGIITQNGN